MKHHAIIGWKTLNETEKRFGSDSFLRFACEISLTHHEKWDGSGYPHGLAGDAIPLSGRLMAVADVYDALTSARPYKKPFTHEAAKALIVEGRGKHFDPEVVDAFLAQETEFLEISRRINDKTES